MAISGTYRNGTCPVVVVISGSCVQLKHGGGACVSFCHPPGHLCTGKRVIGQQAGYRKAAGLLLIRVICLKSQNNQYESKTVTGCQRWKVIEVALSVKYLSLPTVITVTVGQVSNRYLSSLFLMQFFSCPCSLYPVRTLNSINRRSCLFW